MTLSSPDSVSIDSDPNFFRIGVLGSDGFAGKLVDGSWVAGGFTVDDLKDFFKPVNDLAEVRRWSKEARASLPDVPTLNDD
jgi:hypothetical protein